jgi:hypothetical protein
MTLRTYLYPFAGLALLHAQSSTGELDITVADATDALIADARVTVTGSETGAVVRTLKTNASGLAAIPLLNPGTYDSEKAGFKTLLQKGVVLRVTEVVSLRMTLDLGDTGQALKTSAPPRLCGDFGPTIQG